MARSLPDIEFIMKKCMDLKLEFMGTDKEPKIGTVIIFICPIHREKGIQKISWSHFKTATKGCKYCCGKNKTTDDFKSELYNILPSVQILGEYKGSETPIRCKCLIDGHEWSPIARSLLYGQGCPICGKERARLKRIKTQEQFVYDMSLVNDDIKILGTYVNNSTPILCKCKIDGYEWYSEPINLLNASAGCHMCTKKRNYEAQALSNEEFLRRVSIVNPTVEPLDKYCSYYVKLKCRCIIHNTIFYQTPHGILAGKNGCTSCVQTSGEKELRHILTKFGFSISEQHSFSDCIFKNALKFDVYLKNENIAIEYDGEQHYFPIDFAGKGEVWAQEQFELTKLRDSIKDKYCYNNNILLIRIPYWEKDNMEYFLYDILYQFNLLEKIS